MVTVEVPFRSFSGTRAIPGKVPIRSPDAPFDNPKRTTYYIEESMSQAFHLPLKPRLLSPIVQTGGGGIPYSKVDIT